jgi:hypothetical protein
LYQWAYNKGTATGKPGGAFILCIAIAAFAEVYHQMLKSTLAQHRLAGKAK